MYRYKAWVQSNRNQQHGRPPFEIIRVFHVGFLESSLGRQFVKYTKGNYDDVADENARRYVRYLKERNKVEYLPEWQWRDYQRESLWCEVGSFGFCAPLLLARAGIYFFIFLCIIKT